MRKSLRGAAAAFVLAVMSAAIVGVTPGQAQPVQTTASGLQIIDTKPGTGASPKTGQTCVMHYTGWLYENGAKGKKFDSSSIAGGRSSSRSAFTRSFPAGTRASPA